MRVNVTFVFQIINFWVSYVLLHKFLFMPIVKLINKKELARKYLIDGIKDKEQALIRLQDEKKKNIDEFRKYLKASYIFTPPQLQAIPLLIIPRKETLDVAIVSAHAKELFIQKAPHAY